MTTTRAASSLTEITVTTATAMTATTTARTSTLTTSAKTTPTAAMSPHLTISGHYFMTKVTQFLPLFVPLIENSIGGDDNKICFSN